MVTVDGFAGGSWSDDVALPFAAQEKIYDVLAGEEEELSSMVAPSLSGAGSMLPMATSSITSACIESLTATSVTISWRVSLLIPATLKYGTTTSYGGSVSGGIGLNQQATLTGLLPGTTYHYKIGSFLLGYTDDQTFTTQSIMISDVVWRCSSDTNGINVVITWNTNIAGTSGVEYGAASSYGSTVSGSSGTSHHVTLTSLVGGTVYHFRAVSAASSNPANVAYSNDMTFSTNIVISDISVMQMTAYAMIISWSTNIAGSSRVDYGTSQSYEQSADGTSSRTPLVIVTDLTPGTTYYFRVASVNNYNSNDVATGVNMQFTTQQANDAEQNGDAGDTTSTALQIVSGVFSGELSSPIDISDYYKLYVYSGQSISAHLNVLSGVNFDLALLDPSGAVKRTSTNGAGTSESITFTADSTGYWYLRMSYVSGSSAGIYSFSVYLTAGQDIFVLDVGSTNDYIITEHLLGISLLSGTGWGDAAGGMRNGTVGSSFLLNLYDNSYQSDTGYLITITYMASQNVIVQVLNNGVWINVATLPGNSATVARSWSFVLDSDYLQDSQSDLGMNVQLRFQNAFKVDKIGAVAYSYKSDFSSPTSQHNPGISLGQGWILDGPVANGTVGATLVVSVPLTRVSYELQLDFLDSRDGQTVQLYTSSGWVNVGTLHRHGSSASIYLDMKDYYDSDASTPGMNLLLRVNGPLYNLTSVTMTPALVDTDIGMPGDESIYSQPMYMFGVTLVDNGNWSGRTISDNGRTVRTTLTAEAAFYFNAPVSGQKYRIDISYKTDNAGLVYQWDGTMYRPVGSLIADGAWHLCTFWTLSGDYFNYPGCVDSFIATPFFISSSGTTVDYIFVNADSDQDTLVDKQEIELGTSPLMADTDSDNLRDDVEVSKGMNPTNPDTDNDGLIDGNEQWSQTWSTDEFMRIDGSGSNDWYVASYKTIYLPAIPSTPAAPITSAWLHVGIAHSDLSNTRVVIYKGGDSYNVHLTERNAVSGTHLFRSWNLFSLGYDVSDFTSASSWSLYIDDWSSGGGQLQYFRIQVNGETDPLDADSDDDGILDGEEVNLGTDGWITNPVLWDTDSDGLNDLNEIIGSTPCGQKTDPARQDSDNDGFDDDVDRKLGDMLLKISVDWVSSSTWGNVFIRFHIDGNDYVTPVINMPSNGDRVYPGYAYYIDMVDSRSSVSTLVQPWNQGWVSDSQLKFNGDSNCEAPPYALGGASDYHVWYGNDVNIGITFSTEARQPANLIVVSGVDGDESYGLEKYGNEYRYTADEQIIVLYVNCVSGASTAHFVSGVNTIMLPRSVAMESNMNYTFADLMGRSGGTIFNGYELKVYYGGSNTAGSVIMIVSANDMTTDEAETLLSEVTHAHGGSVVGESTRISGDAVYRLHLPLDALDAIVLQDVVNSPLRDHGPNDYLGVITNIVYDFFLGAVNFFANLAQFVVDLGLAVIGALKSLTQQASNAIGAAVTVISNALNAFKTWAMQFIEDTLETLFGPIINTIQNVLDDYRNNIIRALGAMAMDYNATSSVSSAALNQLGNAIQGDLFWILFGAVTIIQVALISLTAATLGTAFLVSFVVSMVISLLVEQVLGAIQDLTAPGNVLSDLASIASGSSLNMNGIYSVLENVFDTAIVSGSSLNMGEAYSVLENPLDKIYTDVTGEGGTLNSEDDGIDLILSLTSYTLGLFSLIFGPAFAGDDIPGITQEYAKKSIILGFLGTAIGYISLSLTAAKNSFMSLLTCSISFLLSGASLFYSVMDMRAHNIGMRSLSGVASALGFGACALSVVSIARSVDSYL